MPRQRHRPGSPCRGGGRSLGPLRGGDERARPGPARPDRSRASDKGRPRFFPPAAESGGARRTSARRRTRAALQLGAAR
ncbi:PREDICTED: translation initiation factor IF-2-like, partial [Chinchilla lanigera]|uniref:translation initiation factor IF-2-like n=1 Tax=Chinchilla lanigera TaxID=34839 RepID=UPI00069725BC